MPPKITSSRNAAEQNRSLPGRLGWETSRRLCLVRVPQIFAALLHTVHHAHLGLAEPLAGIVVALVRLLGAVRVADLALQVALFCLIEVQDTLPVGPLRVGVDVHL